MEPAASEISEPQPPELPGIFLRADTLDPGAVFKPLPKLDTHPKLMAELNRQKRAYAKFLRNLAPEPVQTRKRIMLESFSRRLQNPEDLKDFSSTLNGAGDWESVRIPDFGGPLGRATLYYRTTFELNAEMISGGALFVCFGGVDYKADVFMNNTHLGSHEGFFAPFESDFTRVARDGQNTLVVVVENDAVCMSNDSWGTDGDKYEGDKIYAATGPGYDEPEVGWHHCPPGMGIYQDVYVEARSSIYVHDIFVRPLPESSRAEVWVEVNSCHTIRQEIGLELSVYGQNFRRTVLRGKKFESVGQAGPGINYYKQIFEIPDARLWELDEPWLYQAQVKVLDSGGGLLDAASRQFGMRSFTMDETGTPKGRLSLNGREIRLRGANTMGFEQQDVMRKDWDQLIDDILLAKICHMNFWRLTQRPVQPEVYDYCDKLGLMTQTDLPLFGVLRRTQFAEAVRQSDEMEHLVRAHPCNIMVTYINEPIPNAWDKPHRHLPRPELERFFVAASAVVKVMNPDRVIKPVDGDYDPPAPGLPDNHCYNGWYNGHGLDLGKLHKGYWQRVKPDWMYGCGEFGAEGLDYADLMRRRYPQHWLPGSHCQEKDWSPSSIPLAQTGRFHYMWFDTRHSMQDWADASQAHQAWVTRIMTEAFRRDNRMVSFAIHLFIDAFPSGWMKTIMDVERHPKPAYFEYREALTPLMACLRSDRYAFFAGENICFEGWVCNDLCTVPANLRLHYQFELDGKVMFAKKTDANVPVCASEFQGYLSIPAPNVETRTSGTIRLALVKGDGTVLHDSQSQIEIFPSTKTGKMPRFYILGAKDGVATKLTEELGHEGGLAAVFSGKIRSSDTILIDDYTLFAEKREVVLAAVESGATAVFLELPEGKYDIAGDEIRVEGCGMGPRHFVSRDTGHPLVAGFAPNDFRFWFDQDAGYVTPLFAAEFVADGWKAILTSGSGGWASLDWKPTLAAAEKPHGNGMLRLCQVKLAGRTLTNPVADIFARRLSRLALAK